MGEELKKPPLDRKNESSSTTWSNLEFKVLGEYEQWKEYKEDPKKSFIGLVKHMIDRPGLGNQKALAFYT